MLIFQSMSRKGNCLDNSIMENFFGLLKQEIYYGVVYYSFDELKSEIERFIKYYNEQRIKEKLRWMSRECDQSCVSNIRQVLTCEERVKLSV